MPLPPIRSLRSLRSLVAVLATASAVACGGDDPPAGPDSGSNPEVVTLTISVGRGVIGSPSSTGPYARGTTLSYAYNAQPGFRDLVVTLDGSPVAAQGTFTMNRARTLVATATQVSTSAVPPGR
jgi:hypothetical protein